MDQLLAIYMEHGRESMLPALYVVERVAQVIAEGGGFEDYLAATGRPSSRPESRSAKVATKASKGSPMADKKAAKKATTDTDTESKVATKMTSTLSKTQITLGATAKYPPEQELDQEQQLPMVLTKENMTIKELNDMFSMTDSEDEDSI
jgi:hypothetical protein